MSMVCIVGDPESIKGCGKTMTLAFLQYLDYKKGRRILSNIEYTFPHEQLNVAKMIYDLENDEREKYQNVSIGIDEFHLFMPSGFSKLNADKDLLINFLYQTRKLDIDVYYVTHRAMNVNNKIRGMIELMLMARKFHVADGSHCVFDNCKEDHYIEVKNANDVDSWVNKEPMYINCNVVGELYPTNQLLPIMPESYWRDKKGGKANKPIVRKSMQDKYEEFLNQTKIEEAEIKRKIAKLEKEIEEDKKLEKEIEKGD